MIRNDCIGPPGGALELNMEANRAKPICFGPRECGKLSLNDGARCRTDMDGVPRSLGPMTYRFRPIYLRFKLLSIPWWAYTTFPDLFTLFNSILSLNLNHHTENHQRELPRR